MKEKGQTLIEIMVALGVSVIIITAIVISVVLAVINTQLAKSQNLATYYAKEGLEIMRQASRSDWNQFAIDTVSGTYCLQKGVTSLDNFEEYLKTNECPFMDQDSGFKREVQITHVNPADPVDNGCKLEYESGPAEDVYGTKVKVTVLWTDGKCSDNDYCHEVSLDSCLQNINDIPAP